MKKILIVLCIIISSCSIIQSGHITDLYKYESVQQKGITFKNIENLELIKLDSFSFYYIVDFNCEKNNIPNIDSSELNFYLIENSIINLEDFSIKLKKSTNRDVFFYLPDKKFKNPNKNFEWFVDYLKNNFVINQKGYLISAKKITI